MTTLSIKHDAHTQVKLRAAFKVAAYVCIALLAALLLGTLLSTDWTLPMDPTIAATFTA